MKKKYHANKFIILIKCNGDFVDEGIDDDDDDDDDIDDESIPIDVCRGISSISSCESCCCLINYKEWK